MNATPEELAAIVEDELRHPSPLPLAEWDERASYSSPRQKGGRTHKGAKGLESESPNGSSSVVPLLIPAEHAAALLSLSTSTWWRLHSAGRTPAAVKVGSLTRWRLSDIEKFVGFASEAGRWICRREFEALLAEGR